jgi:hypothetical protein
VSDEVLIFKPLETFDPLTLARLVAVAENRADPELLEQLPWGISEYGDHYVTVEGREWTEEKRHGWYLTKLGEQVVSLVLALREAMEGTS